MTVAVTTSTVLPCGATCMYTASGPLVGESRADLVLARGALQTDDLSAWSIKTSELQSDLLGLTGRSVGAFGCVAGLSFTVDLAVRSNYGELSGRVTVADGRPSLGPLPHQPSRAELAIATEYRRLVSVSCGDGGLRDLLGPFGSLDGDVACLSAFVGLLLSLDRSGSPEWPLARLLIEAEENCPSAVRGDSTWIP